MNSLKHQKVLIVEDEEHHRLLARLALEQAGYRVFTAATGYEALDCVASARPDLVILDVGLEDDMDGFEFLAQLKGNAMSATVPVMVLSANILREYVSRALKAGAEYYMTKPYRTRDLVAHVQRILASHAEEQTPHELHTHQ